MLLADFIRKSISRLEALYPSPEARGLVLFLCEERLGVKNYTHIIEPEFEIPTSGLEVLERDMDRLCDAEPIQYVLGYTEFCGRRFNVGPGVLIPRPETELLVAEAIKEIDIRETPCRVLDLCTGSGCIAWSVALERPQCEVMAVDISDAALDIARAQYESLNPGFIKADVLHDAESFNHGSFDLLLSNPPYVMDKERQLMRPNVLRYEPEIALFVEDEDPLVFYVALARWAGLHLKPSGVGIVEINETLGEETADVFRQAGFGDVRIIDDFFGKSRFVKFSH